MQRKDKSEDKGSDIIAGNDRQKVANYVNIAKCISLALVPGRVCKPKVGPVMASGSMTNTIACNLIPHVPALLLN